MSYSTVSLDREGAVAHLTLNRPEVLNAANPQLVRDLRAAGEEVGQTLSVASAFFDVEPADLPALDEALFAGYLAGLTDAGWRGDPRRVRLAYAAHAALRNLFNAVGASVPDAAGRARARRNYGQSWEDLAGRRAAVRPYLLALAAEARDLAGVL